MTYTCIQLEDEVMKPKVKESFGGEKKSVKRSSKDEGNDWMFVLMIFLQNVNSINNVKLFSHELSVLNNI